MSETKANPTPAAPEATNASPKAEAGSAAPAAAPAAATAPAAPPAAPAPAKTAPAAPKAGAAPATRTFRVLNNKLYHDGKRLRRGDSVQLTEEEYKRHTKHFVRPEDFKE